ncbi:MAG TPA: hypothetical protein VEK80_00050 [Kribbellaceae bacterium]|nr:hypothetical protein [Kribbellaceae bacterium]
MKTLGVALGAISLAAIGWVVNAPAADAVSSCHGSVLVSADYVRMFGGSPVVGSIQLRRDSCYRYWGQVIMYEPMKPNTFAIAYIMKYTDGRRGKPISCDARGGNGRVTAGQTTCRTPKISARSGDIKLVASGHEFQNGGNGWTRISWGQTRTTR